MSERFPGKTPGIEPPVGMELCLGADLARREIPVGFDHLRRRHPDLGASGEPDDMRVDVVNGVERFPASR